jgi:hemerythrin-like domain-containing protein
MGEQSVTTLGTYDTDVSDMYAVHKAILGALDAAPAYIADAGRDADRVETIGSFNENVIEFLHVHHGSEDEVLYPVLEARCAESRSVLERIDDQHKSLYAPMDASRSANAAWRAAPSTDSAQAVIDAVGSIAEALRPHLAEEETTVLPIAAKWISAEEWGRLAGHGMMTFRADKPWLMVGLVLEQLDQEHRDGMLAGMPHEMRTKWTEHMEPAFNAFITEVRR